MTTPGKKGPTRPHVWTPLTNFSAWGTERPWVLRGDGAYSKALKHLTSEGMLDASSPNVVAEMQALHPTKKTPVARTNPCTLT